ALDPAHRWRGEMRRAAQRVGVAIALQEAAPGLSGRRRIDVELHRHFGIACLDWRMHEIAREHGVIPGLAEPESGMAGRVTRRRQDTDVIADRMLVADHLMALCLDNG